MLATSPGLTCSVPPGPHVVPGATPLRPCVIVHIYCAEAAPNMVAQRVACVVQGWSERWDSKFLFTRHNQGSYLQRDTSALVEVLELLMNS